MLTSLCPALASLLGAHDGDTRFFALQKFSDIMLVYVNEQSLYSPPPIGGAAAPPPVGGGGHSDAGVDAGMATATVDKLLREARTVPHSTAHRQHNARPCPALHCASTCSLVRTRSRRVVVPTGCAVMCCDVLCCDVMCCDVLCCDVLYLTGVPTPSVRAAGGRRSDPTLCAEAALNCHGAIASPCHGG